MKKEKRELGDEKIKRCLGMTNKKVLGITE